MYTALQQPGYRGGCQTRYNTGLRGQPPPGWPALTAAVVVYLTDATATLTLATPSIRRVVPLSTLRPTAPRARGIYERGWTQQLNLYAMILCQCYVTIPPNKCATGSS